MHETSRLDIDLAAIDHNMRVLQGVIGPNCAICPIVKADAYGLGIVRIAKRLVHDGALMLAVYSPREACMLLRSPVDCPILVLMPVREVGRVDELYRGLVCDRVHLAVHDQVHLDDLIRMTDTFGMRISVHLEVDTGLSRGGTRHEAAGEMLERIAAHPRLRLAGLFSHFACAAVDPAKTDAQCERFEALLERHADLIPPDCVIHLANTAATLRSERFHRTMVRVGLGWAGYGSELVGEASLLNGQRLKPAINWTSRIVQTKRVPAGGTVGYRAEWTASRETIVGLVPVGYADGWPTRLAATDQREAPCCVGVEVRTPEGSVTGYARPIGAVSMDQMALDLTDLVDEQRGCEIPAGATVQLIGPDPEAPNHLMTLAQAAGVLPHELLSRLHPRIQRVYRLPQAQRHVPAVARTAMM